MVRMRMQKLNKAIAGARVRAGLSLREVEKMTGISNSLISQIETGHVVEPSFRNVVKLSVVLDINLDYLADCK